MAVGLEDLVLDRVINLRKIGYDISIYLHLFVQHNIHLFFNIILSRNREGECKGSRKSRKSKSSGIITNA